MSPRPFLRTAIRRSSRPAPASATAALVPITAAAIPDTLALITAAAALVLSGCSSLARPAAPAATGKLLTLDDLYDPEKKVDFSGRPPTNLVWLDDAHWLWPKTDPKTRKTEWLKVEALTGKSEPFDAPEKVEKALLPVLTAIADAKPENAKEPERGLARKQAEDRARRLARQDPGAWKGDGPKGLLFGIDKDLWVYRFATDQLVQVTSTPDEEEEEAALSPDGELVAFVRGNNLWVADVDPPLERALTTDGSATVLNGKLDWLYQEEVYGRGTFRSFWWSPDSRSIAFLRLDEAGVPIYTLVDDVASPAKVETSLYPRAGDTNPTVKLGVAAIPTGELGWIDLSKYAGGEFLIVDVAWNAKSELFFQVQDREQTWLDLNLCEPLRQPDFTLGTREPPDDPSLPRTLIRETSPAWVNVNGSPTWLADGTFLWFSENTEPSPGWKHLYRHKADGTRIGPVTKGKWEARALRGVDEKNGWVYFSGTERSHVGSDEYRVKLDGSGMQRLTQEEGSHSGNFNPSWTMVLDNWSNLTTPTQVRLHKADGSEMRVVDENKVLAIAEYHLSKPELVKVPTRDGFEMEALLIKPPDFDPSRRYPVFQSTYAGPHAQTVRNAWGGGAGMFLQMLAQKGVVVWECDNRTASGKGAESEWQCYKRFGETELADIEDGLAWLKKQPWVDASRIGISGWSFGGFMASYALTHSTSFAMGIAGGTVSDWANYDTIYTERYMLTPQHNPDGYKGTAVVPAAKELHGELLLIHGELDDNVHPQNTMQLAYALQKAGKPFRLMIYPKSSHGVSDPQLVKQMRAMMLAFIEETLLGKGTPESVR